MSSKKRRSHIRVKFSDENQPSVDAAAEHYTTDQKPNNRSYEGYRFPNLQQLFKNKQSTAPAEEDRAAVVSRSVDATPNEEPRAAAAAQKSEEKNIDSEASEFIRRRHQNY